jgi:serine/threonine-protein kinase RsbW
MRITRAAELGNLAVLRDFIEQACQRWSIPGSIGHDLKLAMDEACANVIQYGYAGMNPGTIILELEHAPNQVIVRIADFGHPFEPYEPEAPELDTVLADQPTPEFGLFFIYKTMDAVDYRTTEEGNCLILTKRLSPEAEQDE